MPTWGSESSNAAAWMLPAACTRTRVRSPAEILSIRERPEPFSSTSECIGSPWFAYQCRTMRRASSSVAGDSLVMGGDLQQQHPRHHVVAVLVDVAHDVRQRARRQPAIVRLAFGSTRLHPRRPGQDAAGILPGGLEEAVDELAMRQRRRVEMLLAAGPDLRAADPDQRAASRPDGRRRS